MMDESTEKLIARYYDGELDGADRKRAEALIAGSAEASASLDRMSRIGQLFQTMSEEVSQNVSFEGLDKRVMNLMKQEAKPVPVTERVRVWVSEVFHHRKAIWIPAVSLAGAAAAALLIVGLSGTTPSIGLPQSAIGTTWQASVVQVAPGSEAVLANADQVNGTSYRIAVDDGATIGVVWINE